MVGMAGYLSKSNLYIIAPHTKSTRAQHYLISKMLDLAKKIHTKGLALVTERYPVCWQHTYSDTFIVCIVILDGIYMDVGSRKMWKS